MLLMPRHNGLDPIHSSRKDFHRFSSGSGRAIPRRNSQHDILDDSDIRHERVAIFSVVSIFRFHPMIESATAVE